MPRFLKDLQVRVGQELHRFTFKFFINFALFLYDHVSSTI